VIGGGDWAADRIVPDAMRALERGEPIGVGNPAATRPWQRVLEPLDGYLLLAERLSADPSLALRLQLRPPAGGSPQRA
jgi:CDP-glucose 4,6-dehydratase